MSAIEIFTLAVSSIALGQSLLAASLLSAKADPRRIYLPLIIFFLANAITELAVVVEAFLLTGLANSWAYFANMCSISANLILAPALWFYVLAITSSGRPKLTKRDLWHLLPFLLGVCYCIALSLMPIDIRDQVIGDSNTTNATPVVILIILVMCLLCVWVVQCTIYIVAIVKRLIRYRSHLKHIFASTEQYELRWILWVAIILFSNLILIVVDILFDVGNDIPLFSNLIPVLSETFNLMLVWSLAHWGLRQKPAFDSDDIGFTVATSHNTNSVEKYQRSGLDKAKMGQIARKIDSAMRESKLYLNSNLSLRMLADKISVLPNYVSQTLNSELDKTFFDYVNGWRILDAKSLIKNSDDTILDIAYQVGFNSRSSFYKAFKLETGMTPTAYRTIKRK